MRALCMVAVLCIGLAACTEKPQNLGTRTAGTASFQGAADPYVASGWKVGDATSWDKHMTTRTQAQNEYVRIGAQ